VCRFPRNCAVTALFEKRVKPAIGENQCAADLDPYGSASFLKAESESESKRKAGSGSVSESTAGSGSGSISKFRSCGGSK
jgi:hypothetical protein